MGVAKNDEQLLTLIADFNLLNVNQLTALSGRSSQVVRRRLRAFKDEDLITTLPTRIRTRSWAARRINKPD